MTLNPFHVLRKKRTWKEAVPFGAISLACWWKNSCARSKPCCAMGYKQEAELAKTEVVSKLKAGSCISGHVAWQTKRQYCFCNIQWSLAWIFKTQCFKQSMAWWPCGCYSNTATPDSVGATVLFPGNCFVCLLCLWAWRTLELLLCWAPAHWQTEGYISADPGGKPGGRKRVYF